jgi:mRNA interferase HigB
MKIISKKNIQAFCEKHPDSKKQLEQWFHITSKSKWKTINEIKETFPYISILSNYRVVFNIKGNDYRVIVLIKYTLSAVYICWVGNHSDYDKIDANTIWEY